MELTIYITQNIQITTVEVAPKYAEELYGAGWLTLFVPCGV